MKQLKESFKSSLWVSIRTGKRYLLGSSHPLRGHWKDGEQVRVTVERIANPQKKSQRERQAKEQK